MSSPSRPWREPMVWLVAGLPAAALLAAIVLIVILVRNTGRNTDDVTEQVQQTSQGHVMAPGSPPP